MRIIVFFLKFQGVEGENFAPILIALSIIDTNKKFAHSLRSK